MPYTARQLKRVAAAKALAERGIKETLGAVAERAGVSAQSITKWLNEEADFRRMVEEFTDRALSKWIPQIDRAMLKMALDGNTAAAKLLYERAGRTSQGIRDVTLDEFSKKINEASQDELEYFLDHGHLPDEAGEYEPEMDEPERVQ